NYEFSPSKNNFTDIRLAPGDYIAVQLRFYYQEGVVYSEQPYLRYIEFYPASLTYGKTPYASDYEDVYNPEKLTDGDIMTYFESKKNLWPGWVIVDMGDVHDVRIINLHLPPLSSWPTRTQTIEIKYSTDHETSIDAGNWEDLFDGPRDYRFDSSEGNMVSIVLDEAVDMRSIILIVIANTAPGGYGAQFSEISVYE
ncbi:MAG: discoidin domain-containing protein, partial [Acholeplasmataceae bacterium]